MKRNPLVVAVGLLTLAFDRPPASAQPTLPSWTEVRLALVRDAVVEGRLIRGDASSLTVKTTAGELVTVPRADILLMTATSTSTQGGAFRTGLVTGALSAVLAARLSAGCDGPSRCGTSAVAASGGGVVGLGLGALIAAAFASPTPQWRAVAPSVRVAGQPAGVTAPELCQPLPSFQANLGVSSAGSQTRGVAITLLCYRGFSIGGEQGTPRSLEDNTSTSAVVGRTYTSTSYSHRHDASFVGGFAEIPVGSVLNPRIIVSAGRYRREDRWATHTFAYGTIAPTDGSTGSTSSSNHLGGGVGVSVSMPCWEHLSIGFEARTHFLAGNGGGTIGTFAATARLRP